MTTCREPHSPSPWKSRPESRRPFTRQSRVLTMWADAATPNKSECDALGPIQQTVSYPPEIEGLFLFALRSCPGVAMDSDVMEGQPCVTGTRIPVRAVLRAIEQYGSIDGVISCYPHLTKGLVEDALYFSQLILELPSGIDQSSAAPR